MDNTDNAQADGYYGDADMGDDELDLSFLDGEKNETETSGGSETETANSSETSETSESQK